MRKCGAVPYEGDEKYIFVSYCHKDSEEVFPIIEQMVKDGYRVWYDEGINPGNDWPEIIADHLSRCSVCIAFISEKSVDSHDCRREINFALLKKKTLISIYLEDVELTAGLEMQLTTTQSILKYNLSDFDNFLKKLYKGNGLECCRDASLAVLDDSDNEESNKDETRGIKKRNKMRLLVISGLSFVLVCTAVALIFVFANPNKPHTDADNIQTIETGPLETTTEVETSTGEASSETDVQQSEPLNPVVAKLKETAKEQKQLETTLSAGINHIVGLKSDGTIIGKGSQSYAELNISGWSDIVSVSAGEGYTVGLKSDGTVILAGEFDDSHSKINNWKDITAISAGGHHIVGLKSDGTVVATGFNAAGQCNVGSWKDIVAISADCNQTIGLKSDGTVVATGENSSGECEVGGWRDIVAVSAGWWHSVALKSDGTVVAMGDSQSGQCSVNDWTDVVSVSAGNEHTVGLKSDGTVVAAGINNFGECNVGDWRDIVAISARSNYTVGLKADGTVVATGENSSGQCDLNNWKDIKLPYYLN